MILTSNTWENERWKEMDRERKKRNATTADAIHSWTCGYFSFTIWISKLACIFLSWSSLVLKEKVKANSKENHIFFLFLFILWFFISMGQRKSEYICNEKGKKKTNTQHTPAKFNKKIKHSEIAYVTEAIRLLRQVYSMLGLCIYTNNTRQKLVHYTRQMNKKKL